MSPRIDLPREKSLQAHAIAVVHYRNSGVGVYNESTFDLTKSFHERIAQYAEAKAAEAVVARYYDEPEYDISIDSRKEVPDLTLKNGLKIEVKWTHWREGQLIIYPNDRDSDIAVLVTGTAPIYYIIGWIPVAAAKSPQFKHSRQNTWWIAQSHLNPIEDLIRSVHAHSKV